MKKLLILLLAVALLAPAALAEDDPAAGFVGGWQDPVYGRARLSIMPGEGEALRVKLVWGDSANSEGVWRMDAAYDAGADALVYTGGSMTLVTYGEDGGVSSEDVRWDDAEGRFTLSDGKLLWADSREDRAAEFAFEPLEKLVPGADEIRERYLQAVADWAPGTAGSSLRLAALCADVLGFADEYRLWDSDEAAVRQSLLDAWLMLDESSMRRFDEDLGEVEALMDMAFEDYDQVAGQFDDAGAPAMAWLARDEEARLSWAALARYTHTMGDED